MQMRLSIDYDPPQLAPGWHVYVKVDGTTTIGTDRQIKAWLRSRKR